MSKNLKHVHDIFSLKILVKICHEHVWQCIENITWITVCDVSYLLLNYFLSNTLLIYLKKCQVLIYIRVFMSLRTIISIILGVLIVIHNGAPKWQWFRKHESNHSFTAWSRTLERHIFRTGNYPTHYYGFIQRPSIHWMAKEVIF